MFSRMFPRATLLRKFAQGVLFFFFSAAASAAPGYLVGFSCYATQAEAENAYYSALPVDFNQPGYAARYFRDPATGVWHYQKLSLATNTFSVVADIPWPGVVYPPCDYTGKTVFDPALAGSFWMFAITIILGVWLLAKNAGIIIDMVKRW